MSCIISFVIAVYNNEKYLPIAVKSILDQVDYLSNIEIIIIDDGSTDNTPHIVDELAKKDSRIHVLHQDNQWIYASFNNGISIASGEYIYIVNSDDKLAEGAVRLLLDNIERYDHPDVIWTKVIWQNVDSEQNILSEYDMNPLISKDEYFDSASEVRDNWMLVKQSNVSLNQANLYKRQMAIAHPFRNDYYAGDTFFNVGIAQDITSMLFLSKPIYNYHAYGDSQLNASIGKFYGYEHKMFNELMDAEINLFSAWEKIDYFYEFLVIDRLRTITYEINALNFRNCEMQFSDKIKYIYTTIADPKIRYLAKTIGREREYESRILTGTRRLLVDCSWTGEIPQYVSILLHYLPSNYLDDYDGTTLDADKIAYAVNFAENKDNIGKVYYSTKW